MVNQQPSMTKYMHLQHRCNRETVAGITNTYLAAPFEHRHVTVAGITYTYLAAPTSKPCARAAVKETLSKYSLRLLSMSEVPLIRCPKAARWSIVLEYFRSGSGTLSV